MKKVVLFCNLPYAFAILEPISKELQTREAQILWYIPSDLKHLFSLDEPYTTNIKELKSFQSDAIFVSGNDLPWYLRGVKVQVFHGLAGEKKGHFRIRDYFDLYLTQGPYFTKRFQELSQKHKDFEVIETGWSKLDKLYKSATDIENLKENYLQNSKTQKILLYAPTFSISLTSAPILLEEIKKLSKDGRYFIIIKFHDKMNREIVTKYKEIECENLKIEECDDITPLLQISDLMISDTSSVVYEFLLLDKPVITLNSHSHHISWSDIRDPKELVTALEETLFGEDKFKKSRKEIIELYHPYSDGSSSKRVVDAVEKYIAKYGVPKKRAIPFHRKLKIWKKFGL